MQSTRAREISFLLWYAFDCLFASLSSGRLKDRSIKEKMCRNLFCKNLGMACTTIGDIYVPLAPNL